ncbi:D-psicose 3-epimerase [Caproicibacter sp. BJN0012]|uniref:D-psicose 3-epimerase n=1 Tax=Caproicibacter sp. BJN0012 TaxID=3110227 RepID=UPI002E0FAC9F
MKFGVLYHYWGKDWACDYIHTAHKVKEAGFDIMEIGANHLHDMSRSELENLKDVSRELNLVLTTNIGPTREYDLSSGDPEVRKAGVRYITETMKNMDFVGSRDIAGAMYSFWPSDFVDTDKSAAWEHSIPEMQKIARVAEDLGIECSLEVLNRFETYILTDCKEGLEYIRRVGSGNVKLLLDTFHMNIEEDNLPNALRLAGDKLGHFHVGEGNRKLPGMGSMPWDEMGRALRDIRYSKSVVIEPFMRCGGEIAKPIHIWRDLTEGADEATMDRNLRKSLAFLKDKFN